MIRIGLAKGLQGDHPGLFYILVDLYSSSSTILLSSYATSAYFAAAQEESGRQWNNQIEVNKA